MTNAAEQTERTMISLAQAEKITGLGRSTLNRFAEAGYFATDLNDHGEQLFPMEELCSLFNIERPAKADFDLDTTQASSTFNSQFIPEIGRTSADFAGGTFISTPSRANSNKVILLPRSPRASESTVGPVNDTPLKVTAPQLPEANVQPVETKTEPEQVQVQVQENDIELKRLQNIIRGQEHEILKLQKVIELQEQLLESREAEIRDQKKQRKWLQERVEKQDLKAERDQLLLISEMQMLTKMYMQQHNKKSVVIQALEWLGFKNPQPLPDNSRLIQQPIARKD